MPKKLRKDENRNTNYSLIMTDFKSSSLRILQSCQNIFVYIEKFMNLSLKI